MRFSIVIPTYQRSAKLALCVKALFAQKFPPSNFEIIVVDDGSQDDTAEVLKQLAQSSPVPFRYCVERHGGQGKARNRGIDEAKGEIILFLGDDIFATKDLLAQHDLIHISHTEESTAVLGFVTWLPTLAITPLMRFMERGGAILGRFGGHQFAYDLLVGKSLADYRFFYTSNISLKRTLLQKHKFDPWFSGYGWQDIELGYRLSQKAGLALYYQSTAVAYHDHLMNDAQFAERMRRIGESSIPIHARYPELRTLPSLRKLMVFRALSHPLMLRILKHLNQDFYFYALSKKYFLEGLGRGYTPK